MIRARILAVALLAPLFAFSCVRAPDSGPPKIRYGDAVCIDCDMIISDERFATALLVEGARGPEPRIFDDLGDMIRYEAENPDLVVTARYVHDYETRQWLTADAAQFLRSPNLLTPMASGIAAFADRDRAERLREELSGEILAFEQLRSE